MVFRWTFRQAKASAPSPFPSPAATHLHSHALNNVCNDSLGISMRETARHSPTAREIPTGSLLSLGHSPIHSTFKITEAHFPRIHKSRSQVDLVDKFTDLAGPRASYSTSIASRQPSPSITLCRGRQCGYRSTTAWFLSRPSIPSNERFHLFRLVVGLVVPGDYTSEYGCEPP
jgi:hypothetical protein